MKNPNPQSKSRIRENMVSNWTNKSVTIVTQVHCSHCKDLLTTLDDLKIPYTKVDISEDIGRKFAIESNSRTTPVIVLLTSDKVNKYLTLDNVSVKCIITEITNHLKSK